ncbi:PspC domain-containing protein [Paraurantiacibacter namhicola]|uniref:PspC domain protein n=1 Tax=Paraurantiacibacter namhicola TaxID=645517 RepID=A0A1C7DAM7_9SPHN|nr:PspC domain-containing protein [Paraurantiacibacter namhicola]ANU08504.1 PspC domain protein [Paraurantiacibacter namhicola]
MNHVSHDDRGGTPTKFRLDKQDAKLMGVCSGLAKYFGMDPLVMRLIFGVGTLVGFGSFIIIYLAIGLLAD